MSRHQKIGTGRVVYHVAPVAKLKTIMKRGLVPAIGDRSQSFGEDRAGTYLFPSKTHVEDAMMGWLGEEFDEEEPLALLEVTLPEGHPVVDDGGFELVSLATIHPRQIRFLSEV